MAHVSNWRLAAWTFAALALVAPSAWGSWAYVAPEVLIDQAEAVVIGRMTGVAAAAGTGAIAVSEVLKGPADLKRAAVRFSPTGGPRLSIALYYEDGQSGVWILSRKNEQGAYPLTYPTFYQPEEAIPAMRRHVARLEGRAWSPPVDGLAAAAVVLAPRHDGAPRHVSLALKNVSDKPIRVCSWAAARGELTLTPVARGESIQFESAPGALRDNEVTELAPGAIHHVTGFEGLPVGEAQIRTAAFVYANERDGKEDGLESIWTGTLRAPALNLVE